MGMLMGDILPSEWRRGKHGLSADRPESRLSQCSSSHSKVYSATTAALADYRFLMIMPVAFVEAYRPTYRPALIDLPSLRARCIDKEKKIMRSENLIFRRDIDSSNLKIEYKIYESQYTKRD